MPPDPPSRAHGTHYIFSSKTKVSCSHAWVKVSAMGLAGMGLIPTFIEEYCEVP